MAHFEAKHYPGYWMEAIENELFRQVVAYMEREQLNQTQLAERLGVTKGRVSQILAGNINFSMRTLVELSLKIGVAPEITFRPLPETVASVYPLPEESRQLLAAEDPA